MEKISCSIVKDLLPLYIDRILSEETTQIIDSHLETCKKCKKDFETMSQELVFPSTPKIQEENEKILKELKHQLKVKQILTAVISVIVIVVVVALTYMIYINVGAVQDYFTENNTVVLHDIHTNDQWETVDFEENEYLNYDRLFCQKEVVVHVNSDASVDLRIRDMDGNIVLDSLTVHPGTSVSLDELKRNTDYKVEIKADAKFIFIRFI